MTVQKYLEDMKRFQSNILTFLDDEQNLEENHQNLILDFQQIGEDQQKLKLLLNLISSIANNHHSYPNLMSKIDKILILLKDSINKYISNREIFDIFRNNKRILLFLINEKLYTVDKIFFDTFNEDDYFEPEITFYEEEDEEEKNDQNDTNNEKEEEKNDQNDTNNEEEEEKNDQNDTNTEEEEKRIFNELRINGQNDNPICKLIREDNIKEFIIYINKNEISLHSSIPKSKYETNSFLLEQKEINLIQYSAFYGSIQIFQYLRSNGVEIESSIWLYAIHGQNSEIIHIIEDEKITPKNEIDNSWSKLRNYSYNECLKESIKCHHNDIANYILNFYLNDSDRNSYLPFFYQYYNFVFLNDDDVTNQSNVKYLIEYNYYAFCEYYLKNQQSNDEKENKSIKKSLYSLIAKKKNVDIIKLFLFSNSLININELVEDVEIPNIEYKYCNTYKTALYLAVECENIEIIKILLSHKDIDVNVLNESIAVFTRHREDENFYYTDEKTKTKKRTALYLAVEKENIKIIKLLLENKKIDVNIMNTSTFDTFWDKHDVIYTEYKKERTALYLAIQKQNIEIINLLLSNNGIDVNILNSIFYTDPSYEYTYCYHDNDSQESDFVGEYSDYVKDNDFNWDEPQSTDKDDKQTVLCLAILNKDIEIIDLLLKNKNIDLNKNSHIDGNELNALHLAVKLGDTEIVKKLLSFDSININGLCKYNSSDEKTALFIATELNNIEMVNILLSSDKIDLNIQNKIDIYYYGYSSKNIIRSICANKTVLYFAVEKGYNEIVKILLSNNKIDVNIVNNITYEDKELNIDKKHKKRTALHLAVKKENIEIIKYLIERKDINRDILDEKNKKAIDYVKNDQIVQLLS